ncbi:hypothetical protein SAMN02799624_04518 [Paenibacillus sp. UNC496MF]|uniref:hypothetical protein n=1 Tax=Paenibacillus sp. UNC496MF TaxID=1502753 RepID=UPI0008E197FE|nr:hypothetical protein [Paenibacillus sp. UNC496MF]SFJ43801.1 hypothetical protein SAMN02799624_04518 [Paenibacillus sp. UNC496MF]
MNQAPQAIPSHLINDRYWKGTLHLFLNHGKLSRFLTDDFIDLQSARIAGDKLKRISAPWSQSEKFLLNLALHLFNERHKVNLSDMDYLDPHNKALAFEALRLRFG